MTEQAANAGTADSSPAPISGSNPTQGAATAAPAADTPINSMRDAHKAAIAELKEGKRRRKPQEGAQKAESESAPNPAGDTVIQGDGVAAQHNHDGKATDPEDGGTGQEPAPLEAPKRWTDERKALFAKQPREVQEAMLAMGKEWETGFNKKFEELAGQRKIAEGVNKLFTPELREQARRAGLDEVGAISRLIAMQQEYNTNPAAYIGRMLKHSGIDPRVFIQGQDAGRTEADPTQAALMPILQPLVQKIQALEAYQANVLRERQDVEATANSNAITEFAGATDSYPHFARVADAMAEIIANDPRLRAMGSVKQKLETAYEMAVWSDPDLRAELISAEAQKRISAMEQDRQSERVAAAATVKPLKPGSHAKSEAITDFRSAHRAALRELGRR